MVKRIMKLVQVYVLGSICAFLLAGCTEPATDDSDMGNITMNVEETDNDANTGEDAENITEESPTQDSEDETEAAIVQNGKPDKFQDTGIATFALSSEDLHDGVWDSVISNTENGLNVSPQLSWEPVPEATSYVIYMVDTTVQDWIHWKSNNVTETTLAQGWALQEEYVGPYPPGGTHEYEIYVFALKEPVERAKGAFNSSNLRFKENAMALDSVTEGASGNIISYGRITGTYTKGE